MNRVRRHARRHRFARAALLLAAAFGVAIYIACSDDPARYEPLSGDPPAAHGGVIAGHVRDGQTAVKGAVVSIEALTNRVPASALAIARDPGLANKVDTSPDASDAYRRVTLTDAGGRFAFDRIPAGEYALQVRADDHMGGHESVQVPSSPALLDTIIVDVNLTPTGTFSGVATLENATSHFNTVVYAEGTSYVAVTDQFGAYFLTDVPVGTYTVRATHSHYVDDSEAGTLTYAGELLGLPAMFLRLDNNIAPVANFTVPVLPIGDREAGDTINFSGSGTDVDGTVVNYEWDFENDGIMDASGQNPSHVFASPGTYTVKFRVTDNQGAIGLAAGQIEIYAPFADVYMAADGSDTNPGTAGSPVLTLAKAYQIATASSKTQIRARAGMYTEVPVFQPGIHIQGGYDAADSSWTQITGVTEFQMGNNRATANGINVPTLIRSVMVIPASTSISNSVGMVSIASTAALQFENCYFYGNLVWSTGSNGANGNPGIPGLNGNPGGLSAGCDAAGPGAAGGAGGAGLVCNGGAGGTGGSSGANSGGFGQIGGCAGGFGGPGGFGGDPGQWGANGGNGTNGASGADGTAANANGSIVGNDWVPSNGGNGGNGGTGLGGGGGGGGGGQGCTFCQNGPGNGGGGGGGGGSGGTGGGGGASGFGSISVLLINSSPTFTSCTFYASQAGNGFNGGNGGNGATGGSGGTGGAVCTSEVGKGGNGGAGGTGGGGGGGAGGAGGCSVGIILSGTSNPTLNSVTFFLQGPPASGGTGGIAGNGGPAAPNGPAGVKANTLTI